MKTLYIDCSMGAAGDMLTAALLELMPDKEKAVAELNGIGVPHVVFAEEPMEKCGIQGTHMSVRIHGVEEDVHENHHHEEHHTHIHHHGEHHHSSMEEITHIVEHLNLEEAVRQDVISVYRSIAEAESHAHGVPVEKIHFHEVGNLDAIADVAAVCFLMHKLAPERVIASPVHVGAGTVKCAHGILPVPAPATAFILQGVPTYGGKIMSELCTPTGAALLKHFVTQFGDMPVMAVEKIGYGMGKKDFPVANCVRVFFGKEPGISVYSLSCNLDDMTGEEIGWAVEQLSSTNALEVFTTPITMKKHRPATLLTVVCEESQREEMVELIFRYTTTLGIRQSAQRLYRKD